MYTKSLVVMLVYSIFFIVETALEDTYCTVPNVDKTNEVEYKIDQKSSPSSTRIIYRTHSQLRTLPSPQRQVMHSISVFQDQGDIGFEIVTPQKTTIIKDNSTKKLVYVFSQWYSILARLILDQTTGKFQYCMLTFMFDAQQNIVSSFQIYNTSQALYNGFNLSQMVPKGIYQTGYKRTFVYFMKASSVYSVIFLGLSYVNIQYIFDCVQCTGNKTYFSNTIANSQFIYDFDLKISFEKIGTKSQLGNWMWNWVKKSFSQYWTGSSFVWNSPSIIKTIGQTIIYEYSNGKTQFVPLIYKVPEDNFTSQTKNAYYMTGQATIYSDNFSNILAVSRDDLVWIRDQWKGIRNFYNFKMMLSQTSLTETSKSAILSLFNSASQVSFQNDSIIIIQKDQASNKGTIIVLKYLVLNTNSNDVVPIFSMVKDAEYSFTMNENNANEIFVQSTSSADYLAKFKCDCVNAQVISLQCFADTLKCLTYTQSKMEDCTKTI